ncbi:vitamin B12-dependent ribonucleotide reductase [Candidatus Microgenomates bacterium]|nr:vitamin B12-dependent ribonucleotide reductase [Candidatus Microgenomates bacterium]
MALVSPSTKIDEPIPAIVRPGRPVKTNGHSNGHTSPTGTVSQRVIVPQLPSDLPQGVWSEQSVKVLKERYLLKNDAGEVVETPDQMAWRVAWDIASADAAYGYSYEQILGAAKKYYGVLATHEFLPNSPTLANAGKNNGLQYSACFVLPVEDTMVGIFDAVKWQAIVHQSGGGTGFAFSRLRPAGSIVKSTKGIASGPVPFMKVFDAATEQVKQGGMRRGANMGILRVDHPDVLEFIHCKETGGVTNFNISVAATDAFMKAYREGTDYDLINPQTKTVVGQLSAQKVMDEIADGAWKTGDPGMIFIDRINTGTGNPVPSFGPVESTNPCGEQPLYPFDVCNLGSIFLGYFVKNADDGAKVIDWVRLEEVIRLAVRFLDSVIDRSPFPLQQIWDTAHAIRRIGLGVGGWADMLARLEIPYNSDRALELGEKVMKFVNEIGHQASQELALERGAFPKFSESIYKDGPAMRNATITTIAPTGTIGIIADASTGIEPFFAIAYKHYVKTNALERSMNFVAPVFEKMATGASWYTDEVKEKIASEGTIAHIEEIPEETRKIFVTAHDISPEWHVKMQSVFQKYTDNAVSKTINLPNTTTREDIKKAYLLAYETGCNGITVYRDGSKSVQVLNLGTTEKKETNGQTPALVPKLSPRPIKVAGATYRIETPLGSAFITVNEDVAGEPFEVFINIGKAGSEVAAMAEALGRMISTTLRFGNHTTPVGRAREIVEQLQGIGGGSAVGFGIHRVRSLPDAVAKAIAMHFSLNGSAAEEKHAETRKDLCPSCGAAAFVYEEGCAKCFACGYSKC